MRVWRLSSSHYPLPDGEGARVHPGRWNLPGIAVVYSSATLSLAVLEALVHVDSDLLPADLVTLSADIPDQLAVETINDHELPPNWREYPAPEALQVTGTQWVQRGQTAVLSIPSVVAPGERNYLLNPAHADFRKIKWSEPSPFKWDPRLLKKKAT